MRFLIRLILNLFPGFFGGQNSSGSSIEALVNNFACQSRPVLREKI